MCIASGGHVKKKIIIKMRNNLSLLLSSSSKFIGLLLLLLNYVSKISCCGYLTVSSLPGNKLELNWNCEEYINSIWIYDKDPIEIPGECEFISGFIDNARDRA